MFIMGNEDLVNEVIELLKRNSEELLRLKEDYKAASEDFLTLQSIEELEKAKKEYGDIIGQLDDSKDEDKDGK